MTWSRRWPSCAALFAIGCLWCSAVAAAADAAPVVLRANVKPHAKGLAIPRHFGGLSYELPELNFRILGNQYTGVNESAARLVDLLTAAGRGNGAPVLHMGGGRADASWWNPGGLPRPPGIEFDLNPFFLDGVKAFRDRTGMPLLIVANMAADRTRYAVDWVRAAMQGFGARNIKAIEIGNEPDVYDRRPYGEGRVARSPRQWTFGRYLSEFDRFARALRALRPRPRLAGPNAAEWNDKTVPFLRRERHAISLVTYHHYPIADCPEDPKDGPPATIPSLLSRKIIRIALNKFIPMVQAARRSHKRIRLSETNSSDCGWKPNGVSDRFATALWGADWMFTMAALGMDGVDFHVSGKMSPFFTNYLGSGWITRVQPLYYGMLLFQEATAGRARLLVGTWLSARARRGVNADAWATRDRRGTIRVVVLHKQATRGGDAVVRIPGARRVATLVRLRARGLGALEPVTLGGQSFASPTDGTPQGARVTERVRPHGGVYRFRLPAASAAMLTVPRR